MAFVVLTLIIDSQVKNLIRLQENDGELLMRILSLETTSCELLESSPTQAVSARMLPTRVIKKELFMKNNEQCTNISIIYIFLH